MASGATQRVPIPQGGHTSTARKTANRDPRHKERTLMIVLIIAAAILLLAIIITLSVILAKPEDNGLIQNNVYAAGINLGGMTPEQAKNALHDATDNTYTRLDMSVQVLNETILLSPAETGAKLDVDAVVEAAYSYGRSDSEETPNMQNSSASYHVPIVEYLDLNTEYIRQTLAALGEKYSTTLAQPTITVSGDKPSMNQSSYDTSIVYQTLTVFVGTAEYGLSTDKLYEQIMDAYSSNLFQVAAECTVLTPNSVDVEALYEAHCSAPVDAQIDSKYNTTPEVYGYGFDLESVRSQISSAPYGTTLEIPLCFIKPNITEEDLAGELFQDILGTAYTFISGNNDLKLNLIQACKDLNGTVLKSGDIFSFNGIIGQPSTRGGYRQVQIMVDKKLEKVVGGGISQVASTLYYAAIKADLSIVERYNHTYAPSFIEPGLDADIAYGAKDLRFTNNTEQPLRIEASVEGDKVTITLYGTNDKDYTIGIVNETVRTYDPVDLIQTLSKDNPGGYKDGDILVDGITGYDIITYKTYLYSDGSSSSEEYEIGQSHYEKRNQIVAELEKEIEPDPTDPPESSVPDESTEPEETTNPSEPMEESDET